MNLRDIEKNPYTPEEKRVVDYFWEHGVGGGDDPIGFILSSYAYLVAERNTLQERLAKSDETIPLPPIPDDDADFTPDLARKIVDQYQMIIRGLRADNDDLERRILDFIDPELKSMRLENGKFNMALGGEVVKRIATMMTVWFRESGAKNYVEITLHAKDEPFESYQFYVQKQGDGARTPHQLLQEVKDERDALRAKLENVNPVIKALRAWFGFQSSSNTNTLYTAAGELFGSTFNPAEYDDVE
jgi:hypothetical protein